MVSINCMDEQEKLAAANKEFDDAEVEWVRLGRPQPLGEVEDYVENKKLNDAELTAFKRYHTAMTARNLAQKAYDACDEAERLKGESLP